LIQCGVEAGLSFGRPGISDGLEQTPVIEPIDPFEGGELDGLDVSQGPRRWITSTL